MSKEHPWGQVEHNYIDVMGGQKQAFFGLGGRRVKPTQCTVIGNANSWS